MAAAVNRPKSFIPTTPSAEEFYTFSRYKVFFLGSKNPWWFTQITFFFGLGGFLYFCIWNTLNFLAVSLVSTYPTAEKIENVFFELGMKYGISEPMIQIKWMALTNMVASGVMFLGLLVIWRRKKIGYYFAFFGQLVCIATPFIFMGMKYVEAELKWFEYSFAFVVSGLLIADFYLRPVGKLIK